MAESSDLKPVITFVVGPTASGKTAWSINHALKNGGVICNADSIQVYKKFDIGSAKPTKEEKKIIPHHLFDIAEPDENFTAGQYRDQARDVIKEWAHQRPLYFVGGSGFYIQALEKGMYSVPVTTLEIKTRLDELESRGAIYGELNSIDPIALMELSINDNYRLRRALEMNLVTGKKMAELKSEHLNNPESLANKYTIRKVGIQIERDALRRRVIERTEKMLESGLIEEVKSLINQGYKDVRAMSSVGYRECLLHIDGQLSLRDLPREIVTSTMQLAKKQMTWFRRDKDIEWISTT